MSVPRLTYWTGIWRPGLEALSNEVALVRGALAPRAPLVSFSSGQPFGLRPAERTIRLGGRHWLALRGLAAGLGPLSTVHHVWGAIDDWHFLRALARQRIVMTVAFGGTPHPLAHYAGVAAFAVEAESLGAQLRAAGVPAERIHVVYPGVDLAAFAPGAPPDGRFRVLFASSPSDPAEFADRGIPHLVALARACPDIDVVLLWRAWGSQDRARAALAALVPPGNLRVETRGSRTMAEVYRAAHVVACPYADGFGKSCPNSVVEGAACGRPALVAADSPIGPLLTGSGAGRAVPRTVEAMTAAVRELEAGWHQHAEAARALAERAFDGRAFVETYRALYGVAAH